MDTNPGLPLLPANPTTGVDSYGIRDREENCVNIWMPTDDSHGWNDHNVKIFLREVN